MQAAVIPGKQSGFLFCNADSKGPTTYNTIPSHNLAAMPQHMPDIGQSQLSPNHLYRCKHDQCLPASKSLRNGRAFLAHYGAEFPRESVPYDTHPKTYS